MKEVIIAKTRNANDAKLLLDIAKRMGAKAKYFNVNREFEDEVPSERFEAGKKTPSAIREKAKKYFTE